MLVRMTVKIFLAIINSPFISKSGLRKKALRNSWNGALSNG